MKILFELLIFTYGQLPFPHLPLRVERLPKMCAAYLLCTLPMDGAPASAPAPASAAGGAEAAVAKPDDDDDNDEAGTSGKGATARVPASGFY